MYEIRNKHTAEKTVKSTDIENVTYTVINYWFKITICSEYRYEPSHWEKKKERKLATVAKQTLVNTGQYFKLNWQSDHCVVDYPITSQIQKCVFFYW